MAAPTWNDAVTVVALVKVNTASLTSGTFTLTNLFGGYLFIRAMRLSSSSPSVGIKVLVRRRLKGQPVGGLGGVQINHPTPLWVGQDTTTASNLTTLNSGPTIPGSTVTLSSATGFAGDQLCGIVDSTSSPTTFDAGRTSKISGSTLTFDSNLTNTGLANGFTITNNLFAPAPIWVDGTPNNGDIEVVLDNGLESTVAYAVIVWGQKLTN